MSGSTPVQALMPLGFGLKMALLFCGIAYSHKTSRTIPSSNIVPGPAPPVTWPAMRMGETTLDWVTQFPEVVSNAILSLP